MTAIAEATAPYALDADRELPTSGGRTARLSAATSSRPRPSRLADGWCRWSCAIRVGRARLHTHLDADESFYVISGELVIHVGDERFEARAGDYVFAPMGIPHAFSVKSENAELFVSFAGAGTDGPLGTGVDGFFKEVATPVVPGGAPPQPAMPDVAEFGAPDGGVRDRARRPATCPLTERVPGWSGSAGSHPIRSRSCP